MNNANKITGYEVRFITVVDRPELRGPTFPVVPADTRLPTTIRCARQSGAVLVAEELIRGESDFGSEYVARVTVLRIYEGRSPAFVRRPVERSRA